MNECGPSGLMVEVGVFCGKSLAYLADTVRASGKAITLHGIDQWGIDTDEIGYALGLKVGPLVAAYGSLEAVCRAGLQGRDVTLVTADSLTASRQYGRETCDLVFLDDDHREAHVSRELEVWWPAVRRGGSLAGHDYDLPGVKYAVDRWAGQHRRVIEVFPPRTWRIRKGA